MASFETLPGELLDLIFEGLAVEIPLQRLLRLRLVSKSCNARVMSSRVFTKAAHEWHIHWCQDKPTLMKWLRWSFRDQLCQNPSMLRFRVIAEDFLRFVDGQSFGISRLQQYSLATVSEVLLSLVADQLIVYRAIAFPPKLRSYTYDRLLWWSGGMGLWEPDTSAYICLCVASAFGDFELFDSMLESAMLHFPRGGMVQWVGRAIWAGVRFGQAHVVAGLLDREGHDQICHERWSILDQAIYSCRHEAPPAAFLNLDYRFKQGCADEQRGVEATREVIYRALATSATYRNYKALEMLVSNRQTTDSPLPEDAQQRLLFAACLGQDSGVAMVKYVFDLFPGLRPNFLINSPRHFATTRTSYLMRPLDAAICRGDVHVVQLLLDHGAVPDHGAETDHPDLIHPSTSFAIAARQGFVTCMALLLKSGLGHYYLSEDAVVNSARSGEPEAVKLVLTSGVRLCVDNQLNTMANAYLAGTHSVIELLRSYGFDSEAAEAKGRLLLAATANTERCLHS